MDDQRLETEARGGTAPARIEPDDVSVALDDDRLPSEMPPEQPMGVDEPAVTAAASRTGESIADRAEREQPVERPPVDAPVGRLVGPDQGVGIDDEPTMIAREVAQVDPGDLPVDDVATGDVTRRETATESAGELAAEEAAMHETEQP